MSGVSSLTQQSQIARTNLEKAQEQQPTGKSGLGALGQRLASFFHSIGTALGLVKSETGVARQEQALTGFKSSLKSEYGRDIGKKSLEDGGIRPRSIKLRDTDVTRSLASAHERREARITDNETLRQKTLGGGVFTRTEDQKKFSELMGGKNGEALKSEYDSRLKERFAIESSFGRKPITPEQAQKIARQELTRLSELNLSGTFEQSGKARREFNTSIDKVVGLLSQGGDPKAIQAAIDEAIGAMTKLVQSEGGRHTPSAKQMEEQVKAAVWLRGRDTIETGGGYQGTSVGNLPREERSREGSGNSGHDSLVVAQKNGLSKGGPLRKVYGETTKNRLDEQQGPEGRKARLTQAMMRGLVGGLGDLVGSLGKTSREDTRQFSTSTNRQSFGG